MQFRSSFHRTALVALIAVMSIRAGYASESAEPGNAVAPALVRPLDGEQDLLASRYLRFEKTLRAMARYLDPAKADLIERALAVGEREGLAGRMQAVAALLEQERFGDALGDQNEVIGELKRMLAILRSESDSDVLKGRIADIEGQRDLVDGLIRKEEENRRTSMRGGRPIEAERQNADAAEKLRDRIAGDAAKAQPESGIQDARGSEPRNGDAGQDGSGKPGAGGNTPSAPSNGRSPSGNDGAGDGKPPDREQPAGLDEIEQARREMERAIEELEKAESPRAIEHQDQAIVELKKARKRLDDLLRQLREEEREQLLAALEQRFQRMLALQKEVNRDTLALHGIFVKDEQVDAIAGRSRELAQKEQLIAEEALKALTLLQEDGTSVSFPLSVEQVREDMLIVARRLDQAQVGDLTQAIEKDIVEALEELIEALQKEMQKKDSEQQPGQPQQQPPGEPQDPALVDAIAELKMLRSLQQRINRRTVRLGTLVEGDQALEADVVAQVRELSTRQAEVQQATYDLATGRNK